MSENKPRVRVFTKSHELVIRENKSDVALKNDTTAKWVLDTESKTTVNNSFSQINFFYNLRP